MIIEAASAAGLLEQSYNKVALWSPLAMIRRVELDQSKIKQINEEMTSLTVATRPYLYEFSVPFIKQNASKPWRE